MNTSSIDPHTVRPSPIAGTWYPGSARELQDTVDGLLAAAEHVPGEGELVGLVAPHAGYPYSGQTAAYAYRQLDDLAFDLVILLGPSHYDDFGPFSISAKKYYATPLGMIELDQDWIAGLSERIPLTRVEHDREHSLEIQLPFLQRTLGSFKLVPLMLSLPIYILGPESLPLIDRLAAALADLARGRRALFVASSDLSHLTDYRAVDRHDARTAELVEAFDLERLGPYMGEGRECRACGDAPVLAVLKATHTLGANKARVLYRTNSAEVTGQHMPGQYTVGYMAVGVYRAGGDSGGV